MQIRKNCRDSFRKFYYSFLLQIFRIFDINNDNTVSQKELSRLVKDLFHLFTKKDNPDRDSQEALATKAFQVKFLWINRWNKGQKVPEMAKRCQKWPNMVPKVAKMVEKGKKSGLLKKTKITRFFFKRSKLVENGHKSSQSQTISALYSAFWSVEPADFKNVIFENISPALSLL